MLVAQSCEISWACG